MGLASRRAATVGFALLAACLVEDTPGFTGSGSSGFGTATDTDGPTPQPLPPAGYEPRGCSFDLDDDGEIGELDSDCQICDGVTLDPDGDGVFEDLYYVDCDSPGNDDDTCGDPDDPCSSIKHTIDNRVPRNSANMGGEDIVCFRGTCTGEDSIALKNGAEGAVMRPPSGSEAREFAYPRDPLMLVGWDFNDDGVYPPFDVADVAVVDGGGQLERFATFSNAGTDEGSSHDIELAHFTIRGYGPNQNTALFDSGFGDPVDRIYVHDLVVENYRRGVGSGENGVFEFASSSNGSPPAGGYHHIALENLLFENHGGWILNEGASHELFGPIRIKNWTTSGHSCDSGGPDACADPNNASAGIWYYPGNVAGLEILDSVFELGTTDWQPRTGAGPLASGSNGPPVAIELGRCNRDVVIRNNRFLDYGIAVRVFGDAANPIFDCEDNVANIRVDANRVHSDYRPLEGAHLPFIVTSVLEDGALPPVGFDDVVLSNNVATASHPTQGCIWIRAAALNGGGGPIAFVNNTCIAELDGVATLPGAAAVSSFALAGMTPVPYVVRNNILDVTGAGASAIVVEAATPDWDSDYNVVTPGAALSWAGAELSLDEWRAASGSGANTVACAPFFDEADGFHLAVDDTCAADAASTFDEVTRDIDGDLRPSGAPWDAGADELPPT